MLQNTIVIITGYPTNVMGPPVNASTCPRPRVDSGKHAVNVITSAETKLI